MENGTTVTGTDSAKLTEGRAHMPGDGIFALTEVMQEHLKEQREERKELNGHFKNLGSTLERYNGHASKLNEGMIDATTAAQGAHEAANTAASSAQNAELEARKVPERLNELKNLDNLKGRACQAVVNVVVTGFVIGAGLLIMSFFGKGEEEATEGPAPQAPIKAVKTT